MAAEPIGPGEVVHTGFQTSAVDDIRAEVWLKLLGNVTFNPISALTDAGVSDICTDVDGRDLEIDALVGSVVELGELVGVPTPTIRAIHQAAKLLDRTMRAGEPQRTNGAASSAVRSPDRRPPGDRVRR